MAIETHNLGASDIKNAGPFAEGHITANSDGLSDTKLENWITEYAGRANAIIVGRDGLPGPGSIGENFRQLVRLYIKAAVVRDAMEKSGKFPDEAIDRQDDKAERLLEDIKTGDVDTGADQNAGDVVNHNVDTSDDKIGPTFSGRREDVW